MDLIYFILFFFTFFKLKNNKIIFYKVFTVLLMEVFF